MIDLIQNYNIPNEVVNIIYSFLPRKMLMWTNKKHYKEGHPELQTLLLSKNMYDNYIRHIIRNDLDIVFSVIIETHKTEKWNKGRYKFKNIKYTNYIHFLDSFMFDNKATKCRNIMFSKFYRKKYKQIHQRIPWSN